VGLFTISFKDNFLQKILMRLVALSSGALLGGSFLHLLPEAAEKMPIEKMFTWVLGAIIAYLIIEKFLHWRHCHKAGGECQIHHSMGYMNLIGDMVHNLIDGLVIASAFLISTPLGITTTLAMAMHEIPQEIGDFGTLLYSGFSRKKALLMNFLTALTAVAGGVLGWSAYFYIENFTAYLLPIAAGGFIYIAVSDILPELRKDSRFSYFLVNFVCLLLGIGFMYIVKLFGAE
jgi:zinc and cadmium transporter